MVLLLMGRKSNSPRLQSKSISMKITESPCVQVQDLGRFSHNRTRFGQFKKYNVIILYMLGLILLGVLIVYFIAIDVLYGVTR